MLSLYRPEINDLWFRQELLADSETMSYNNDWGGTISFPKEKWTDWYNYWIAGKENMQYYRYLLNTAINEFVGEVSYHYDISRKIYICSIIIHNKHRRKGYGTEGLRILCEAAKSNGIITLFDDISSKNPSVKFFLNNGFKIDYATDEIVMVKKLL